MEIKNKKAFFDYEILEKFEAGIVLKGPEVKSIRQGSASLKDSFGKIEKGEVYLYLYIAPYPSSFEKIDPMRKKKLLLHKNQILKLSKKVEEKGLTIVPLSLYFNKKGIAKVEIALVKGKKLYDKRMALKKKEVERDIGRQLKSNFTNKS